MSEIVTSPASTVLKRSDALDEPKWKFLLSRIQRQRCTPFLGPETCFDFSIPSASVIADEWAGMHGYPLEDRTVLPRVAQFVAYNSYGMVDAVKEELADRFRGLKAPDFANPDEPYRILASLPMSVYINTHYYAFMSLALLSQYREPQRMICRWYDNKAVDDSVDLPAAYDPKPACPLVFHMFGHVAEPRSLVLTEDDYLDFLVRTSENPDLIPTPVQNAMTNHSLLFFGYHMTDLDFRVLLRSLNRIWLRAGTRQGSNYTTQLVHVGEKAVTSDQIDQIKKYFNQYCSACASVSIGVYWGSTNEFVTELRQRWEDYRVNNAVG
jgi:SIR2-like domain